MLRRLFALAALIAAPAQAADWLVPKVSYYTASSGVFYPDARTQLIHVKIIAGGGGGAGTAANNLIPRAQNGARGQDSWFDSWPTTGVTISISAQGHCVVHWPNHDKLADQPLFLTSTGNLPAALVMWQNYFVYGPSITADTFELAADPYSPPYPDSQAPLACADTGGGSHYATAYRYVVQGGGGAGVVGDQGTPLGFRGFYNETPYRSSWAVQGGTGSWSAGGNGCLGGGGGDQFLNGGNAGNNMTGGGGGGAGATNDGYYAGTGGAAGACGEIWMKPRGVGMYFRAGAGGVGGAAGIGGYPGGFGGNGALVITEYIVAP